MKELEIDQLALILDNLQANIRAENQELIKLYKAKKKACEDAKESLRRQNQFLLELKELPLQLKDISRKTEYILKAIRASNAALRRDHYLLIELLNFVLKQNGNNDNEILEHLLKEVKSRQHVNFNLDLPTGGDSTVIKTGDNTNLDFNNVGRDNKST